MSTGRRSGPRRRYLATPWHHVVLLLKFLTLWSLWKRRQEAEAAGAAATARSGGGDKKCSGGGCRSGDKKRRQRRQEAAAATRSGVDCGGSAVQIRSDLDSNKENRKTNPLKKNTLNAEAVLVGGGVQVSRASREPWQDMEGGASSLHNPEEYEMQGAGVFKKKEDFRNSAGKEM
ncbi:hypothetical protein QQ045_003995 [Rhodiola kirilowii]